MEQKNEGSGVQRGAAFAGEASKKMPSAEDPLVALALLEADQVVVAKRYTRFGERRLTRRQKLILWALRIYVLGMLLIVALSVFRAIHNGP